MEENLATDGELLTFFKALADASRLKIVGLLAQQPHTVEELAAMLNLRPSTVSHHLSKLTEAGLVSARPESYYNVYRLEKSALEQAARRLRAQDPFPSATSGTEAGAYERKVWHDFLTPEGRLKTIPAQRKKLDIILRRLAQEFQPGVRYPEKLVNEILKNYHDDTARLRRELIGARLLQREHGEYWRVEENEL
jgi:DNA-binding HxlR family transcriptional regulator